MSYYLFQLPYQEFTIADLSYLEPGQLIKRRIEDLSFFGLKPFHHYGIIYEIQDYDLDGIFVAEFNIDTNKRICSLREFMYGMDKFKIVDYRKGYSNSEQANLIYSELINDVDKILSNCRYRFNGDTYHAKTNNCEDFVYSCIFKRPIPCSQLTHLRLNTSLLKYLTLSGSYLYISSDYFI